jgi:hypothetical protein
MHINVVNRCLELRKRIEPRLLRAPSEIATPVLGKAA